MCSGAHLVQMDSHPSSVGCFLESIVRCKPQPQIRSCILKVCSCVLEGGVCVLCSVYISIGSLLLGNPNLKEPYLTHSTSSQGDQEVSRVGRPATDYKIVVRP